MASATAPLFVSLRGRIGDLIFRQQHGRTIVYSAPARRPVDPTARQLVQRQRFREATLYARNALSNPAARDFYTQSGRERGITAQAAAHRDRLSPPVIEDIALGLFDGLAGDEIVITAHDDSEVVEVRVQVKDMTGRLLERGVAVARPGAWVYEATTTAPVGHPLTIEVTAMDRAGNEVTRTTPWVPTDQA
jgi:hypothetical protein